MAKKSTSKKRGAAKGPRSRSVEMPTRERMLSLIKILDSFSEETPVIKKNLLKLLRYEYENYIFRQLISSLKDSGISDEDFLEAEDLLLQLIESNEAKFRLLRDSVVYADNNSFENEDDKELVLDAEDLEIRIDDLIDLFPESFSESSRAAKLVNALSDIRNNNLKLWISPATLISDLNVLLDKNFGLVGKSKPKDTRWNSYGYYSKRGNRDLEIWELKILYESIVSNQFLEYEEIKNITETILKQTSREKHDRAASICHELVHSYYTQSSQFKNNLKQLIDFYLNSHRVQFEYVHSTVNRGEYIKDDDSLKEVVPVDIVVKDGFYYLLGATESGIRPYRIDRIRNLTDLGRDYSGLLKKHPEYAMEKNRFYRNNTNNFSGGSNVEVIVKWDFDIMSYYTPLFDVFGYENVSQGPTPDQFIIKTRDNYGMYLNLLRLGPVIEVVGPGSVRYAYSSLINAMMKKHQ